MVSPEPYLTLGIDGERFGLPLLRVREVVAFEHATRIPTMPPCIRGVTNLRGQVLPVVDLGIKLGLAPVAITKRTCIVVVEARWNDEAMPLGVLTDVVHDVVDLGPGDVDPPPPFGTRVRLEFLRGLGKVGAVLVLLLDVDRVLSEAELLAASEASRSPPGPVAHEADEAHEAVAPRSG